LSQILNRWDIFVGYAPQADEDPANLDEMLDRQKILAPPKAMAAPPVPAAPVGDIAFSLPVQAPPRPAEFLSEAEIVERWRSLTRREKQVVALLCQGRNSREIATQLDTKPSTIDTHISNAFHKFDLRTRGGLQAVLADWDFSSVSLK
jgi:DNA-binding CsgD family transcriptional regulator